MVPECDGHAIEELMHRNGGCVIAGSRGWPCVLATAYVTTS